MFYLVGPSRKARVTGEKDTGNNVEIPDGSAALTGPETTPDQTSRSSNAAGSTQLSRWPNELSFINITGSRGHGDPSVKKTVRAHVMRRYRREKRDHDRNKKQLNKQPGSANVRSTFETGNIFRSTCQSATTRMNQCLSSSTFSESTAYLPTNTSIEPFGKLDDVREVAPTACKVCRFIRLCSPSPRQCWMAYLFL